MLKLKEQSLTETYVKKDQTTNSMGLIELGENLTWEVFGNDRIKIQQPINTGNWASPIEKMKPKSIKNK